MMNENIVKTLEKEYSTLSEKKNYVEVDERITLYLTIMDEMNITPTRWPILSSDAVMLDEVLIHTKKENLEPEHRIFVKKLIERLLEKINNIAV